jgi:hypothetical protein
MDLININKGSEKVFPFVKAGIINYLEVNSEAMTLRIRNATLQRCITRFFPKVFMTKDSKSCTIQKVIKLMAFIQNDEREHYIHLTMGQNNLDGGRA